MPKQPRKKCSKSFSLCRAFVFGKKAVLDYRHTDSSLLCCGCLASLFQFLGHNSTSPLIPVNGIRHVQIAPNSNFMLLFGKTFNTSGCLWPLHPRLHSRLPVLAPSERNLQITSHPCALESSVGLVCFENPAKLKQKSLKNVFYFQCKKNAQFGKLENNPKESGGIKLVWI